jgi:methyl-accepting chemotaxis protein
MSWFQNLKIFTKLLSAFFILLALSTGIGIFALRQLSSLNDATRRIVDDELQAVVLFNSFLNDVRSYRIAEMQHVLSTEPEQMKQAERAMEALMVKMGKNAEKYDPLITDPGERRLYDELVAKWYEYAADHDRTLELSRKNETEQAKALVNGRSSKAFEAMLAMQDGVMDLNVQSSRRAADVAASTYAAARSLITTLIGAGILLGLILCLSIAWSISRPLAEAVTVADRIAEGDLTMRIDVTREDETGRLLASMSGMAQRLAQVMGEVRSGAVALTSAAAQVSSSSQSLSQGTAEQASSVQETTASLEEMNATIEQNSQHSRQMEQIAVKGAKEASESGEAVTQTVEAMSAIARKISIIEEIAYQTNLLALNAAIEAARAGEHGRGFAVVATEVRKLAERSRAAAQEISELAGKSVKVAERSGVLLGELVPSIQKTALLVQEVVAASGEQAAGVRQVNRAMLQVDQVTQRNASAAEELSATAEEMSAQADTLQQLVSFFRVGEGDGRTPVPAVSRGAGGKPGGGRQAAPGAWSVQAPAQGLKAASHGSLPAAREESTPSLPDEDREFKRF